MAIKLILNELRKWMYEKKFKVFIGIMLIFTLCFGVILKMDKSMDIENGLYFVYLLLLVGSYIIILFTIIYAGEIVAKEFNQGTIKQLMIRPYSRNTILLSKYIVTILLGVIQFLVVLVFAYIIGGILFGFSIKSDMLEFWTIFSKGILIEFIVSITGAFMLGVLTRSSLIATSITIVLHLTSSSVRTILINFYPKLGDYYLYTILNLNRLPKGISEGKSLIVILVYFILFICISFISFNNRDIE